MSGHPSEAKAQLRRRQRHAVGSVHHARRTVRHTIRQRAGVHSPGSARLDRCSRREDRLHRARQSLVERVLRELQRAPQGRTPQLRDIHTMREAEILIEQWRRHYNTKRPHSSLGYRPPAPEAAVPIDRTPIMN